MSAGINCAIAAGLFFAFGLFRFELMVLCDDVRACKDVTDTFWSICRKTRFTAKFYAPRRYKLHMPHCCYAMSTLLQCHNCAGICHSLLCLA